MKTLAGKVFLDPIRDGLNFNQYSKVAYYTDETDTQIVVPASTVVHLYELSKFVYEQSGNEKSWDQYCDDLMKDRMDNKS
jgi:hypothetical protein